MAASCGICANSVHGSPRGILASTWSGNVFSVACSKEVTVVPVPLRSRRFRVAFPTIVRGGGDRFTALSWRSSFQRAHCGGAVYPESIMTFGQDGGMRMFENVVCTILPRRSEITRQPEVNPMSRRPTCAPAGAEFSIFVGAGRRPR